MDRPPLGQGVKRSPVVSGVSDGSLAAQPVALLHVEGVVSVRVIARLQLLPGQVGFVIEGAEQLTLLLRPRERGHLRGNDQNNGACLHDRHLPKRVHQ